MSVDTDGELRQEAEELRKSGKFKESREKYTLLWDHSQRVLYGAGLLNCLRKLNEFDEALKLANELEPRCGELSWCKNEVAWTYIYGILSNVGENEPLQRTLDIAERIMALSPEGGPLEKTVFEVLDRAKDAGDWNVVDQWVTKVSPENISAEPMKIGNGKEGWSRRAQWYNYRINSLIETGRCEGAIKIVDEILSQFPRQRKFFLRLKAVAFHRLGRLDNAMGVYDELCKNPHVDWWILRDYGKLLKDINEPGQALKTLFRAALSKAELELMVGLFEDIGTLAAELNRPSESLPHLYLVKYIREKNGWKLSQNLSTQLAKVGLAMPNATPPADIGQALAQCRVIWNKYSPRSTAQQGTTKKGLKGKVTGSNLDRTFCFISVDVSENYFCFKSDLPAGTKDGDRVTFDVVPSYDKKKQKDSWKAVNVRSLTSTT